MMTPADRGYYEQRMLQERHRAAAAAQPETRRAHADMAQRYAALLGDPAVLAAA